MWQRLLNIGIALHGLILVSSQLVKNTVAFLVTQGLVVGMIAGVGILLQWKRYPSLLTRKPGQDISILFRFQLGNKVKAAELEEHKLDYMSRQQSKAKPS